MSKSRSIVLHLLLDILVKPGDRLDKGLLLGVLLARLGEVASHGEAVLNVGEHVNLVGQIKLVENLLTLVALLGCEDKVANYFLLVMSLELIQDISKCVNLPAAAMLRGPSIPRSSSASTMVG